MTAVATGTTLAVCRSVTVVHGRGDTTVTALHEVDLSIAANEHVGLWGRSGSGKTTLLHVLAGLTTPTYGEVTLSGRRAVVFQAANLLPSFTAFENVAFARHVSGAGGDRGPAELLELVGLAAKLDALPAELSGGEAQRVAIARALAQAPDLLLCDEPTGQLDSDTGSRVLDLVGALHERAGFALVIATHDPDVATRADRVLTLDDGRLVTDQALPSA